MVASLDREELPEAAPAAVTILEAPQAPQRSPFAPTDTFPRRHLGPSDAEEREMLGLLGLPSLAALVDETVPESIRLSAPLALAGLSPERPLGESELLAALRQMLAKNR